MRRPLGRSPGRQRQRPQRPAASPNTPRNVSRHLPAGVAACSYPLAASRGSTTGKPSTTPAPYMCRWQDARMPGHPGRMQAELMMIAPQALEHAHACARMCVCVCVQAGCGERSENAGRALGGGASASRGHDHSLRRDAAATKQPPACARDRQGTRVGEAARRRNGEQAIPQSWRVEGATSVASTDC